MRVFRSPGLVYQPSERLYVRTINLSGCMGICSRYMLPPLGDPIMLLALPAIDSDVTVVTYLVPLAVRDLGFVAVESVNISVQIYYFLLLCRLFL